jgi:hypothetical protein
MDEQMRTTDDELANDSTEQPESTDDANVIDEPVGPDNIRDGTVRGTMHGGATKSEGQGQGG